VCGQAELDPAMKLLFTSEKPLIPGWYWYCVNQKETKAVVVYVQPQLDKGGTGEAGTSPTIGQQVTISEYLLTISDEE
jgi:hypothetical protein